MKLRKKVLEVLNSKLPKELYYHNVRHILDVFKVVNQYIRRDKIDKKSAYLLRIGALLHDIGFITTKIEHEEKGTEIAKELMSQFGYPEEDIKIVQGLIRATKVPQYPQNKLERILCDSDLDYLGRKDFYEISDQLYRELKEASIVSNVDEWNKLQIKFLESHEYHTDFAKKNRQPNKEKRILEIKKLISN
ncbi:HD domain-containing protein [Yeosuana sp.]|uniref:HD domain-containing protein n=1 Tax=Yeosuana sp. TaxID=2529388 RepID=UPI004054F258